MTASLKSLVLNRVQDLCGFLGFRLYRLPPRSSILSVIDYLTPEKTEFELVRVGSPRDGGYLVPDDLRGISAVYSPGVDQVSDFEYFFAEQEIACRLADYSVSAPPSNHPNYHFIQKFLGGLDEEHTITLTSWINSYGDTGNDLLLQMDIEGSEYEVLESTAIETLKKFRIMVIEFHHLSDYLAKKSEIERILRLLKRISTEFGVVHVHPNNCCGERYLRGLPIPGVVEVTFHRRDRYKRVPGFIQIPHTLNQPNLPNKRLPRVPTQWRGAKK
jgi:hypothetical protein